MQPYIAVPAILALVYRAYSRNSLTPLGIVTAALTATVHALHPQSVFFWLLVIFYLTGTAATKVKHEIKARLTLSSTGASGGEGARTHVQVLANSIVASILILLHAYSMRREADQCFRNGAKGRPSDILVVGIIGNYVAVAADTLSSELGILSKSKPRLITAPWRQVAPGTNGGVTLAGLLAGLGGAAIISVTFVLLTVFCGGGSLFQLEGLAFNAVSWEWSDRLAFAATMTILGLCGSLLDSLLGALVQASVVDVRTGKVVEGAGGKRVAVHASGSSATGTSPTLRSKSSGAKKGTADTHHESRQVATGMDLLDNNGVNFAMAAMISLAAMVFYAVKWDVPLGSIIPRALE